MAAKSVSKPGFLLCLGGVSFVLEDAVTAVCEDGLKVLPENPSPDMASAPAAKNDSLRVWQCDGGAYTLAIAKEYVVLTACRCADLLLHAAVVAGDGHGDLAGERGERLPVSFLQACSPSIAPDIPAVCLDLFPVLRLGAKADKQHCRYGGQPSHQSLPSPASEKPSSIQSETSEP